MASEVGHTLLLVIEVYGSKKLPRKYTECESKKMSVSVECKPYKLSAHTVGNDSYWISMIR